MVIVTMVIIIITIAVITDSIAIMDIAFVSLCYDAMVKRWLGLVLGGLGADFSEGGCSMQPFLGSRVSPRRAVLGESGSPSDCLNPDNHQELLFVSCSRLLVPPHMSDMSL